MKQDPMHEYEKFTGKQVTCTVKLVKNQTAYLPVHSINMFRPSYLSNWWLKPSARVLKNILLGICRELRCPLAQHDTFNQIKLTFIISTSHGGTVCKC
jgi:hypothetical protein